jgi:hypothetical protein
MIKYKNIMKALKLLVISLLSTVFFISCSDEFLNLSPKVQPTPDNFLDSEETAKKLVIAAYNPWVTNSQMYGKRFITICDALTDDCGLRLNGSSLVQVHDWEITPTHEYPRDWWMHAYRSVNAANYAIQELTKLINNGMAESIMNPYIAEARFMRAFSYIFLVSFYGEVPLIEYPLSSFEEFSQPRASIESIWALIESDLNFAKVNLTEDGGAYKGTPVKATAAAYLSKAYLYQQKYSDAETAAREAVSLASSEGFYLVDDYESIFSVNNEGNPELLFYLQYERNNSLWQNNLPVESNIRDLPSQFQHIQGGEGWGYRIPARDLYDAFESDDPRRGYTIYAPGDVFGIYAGTAPFTYTNKTYNEEGQEVSTKNTYNSGDIVRYDYQWSPTGMSVKKLTENLAGLTNVRYAGMDRPLMRVADLYLILAEALAEQGKEEALIWVNKVRARQSVNMPPKTTADGTLRDIVRHERRVELAMEGHRIFDLLRWNALKSVFGDGKKVKLHFFSDFLPDDNSNKYKTAIGLRKYPTDHILFPIPQNELDQNPSIVNNNPGY